MKRVIKDVLPTEIGGTDQRSCQGNVADDAYHFARPKRLVYNAISTRRVVKQAAVGEST